MGLLEALVGSRAVVRERDSVGALVAVESLRLFLASARPEPFVPEATPAERETTTATALAALLRLTHSPRPDPLSLSPVRSCFSLS